MFKLVSGSGTGQDPSLRVKFQDSRVQSLGSSSRGRGYKGYYNNCYITIMTVALIDIKGFGALLFHVVIVTAPLILRRFAARVFFVCHHTSS